MDVAETAAILGTSQTVEVWEKARPGHRQWSLPGVKVAILTRNGCFTLRSRKSDEDLLGVLSAGSMLWMRLYAGPPFPAP
jgi:hypothetical protein